MSVQPQRENLKCELGNCQREINIIVNVERWDLDLDLLIVEERLKMIDAWVPWIFSHYSFFLPLLLAITN